MCKSKFCRSSSLNSPFLTRKELFKTFLQTEDMLENVVTAIFITTARGRNFQRRTTALDWARRNTAQNIINFACKPCLIGHITRKWRCHCGTWMEHQVGWNNQLPQCGTSGGVGQPVLHHDQVTKLWSVRGLFLLNHISWLWCKEVNFIFGEVAHGQSTCFCWWIKLDYSKQK